MKPVSVKEYTENDLNDVAALLWTNIGLRTSLSPVESLAVTAASSEGDKTLLCANLAAHLAGLNKKTLLIDLDRQGSSFKRFLRYDTNFGFSDYCYRLFQEPFLSRRVADYGFADLIRLFFYKRRTGSLSLVQKDRKTVVIELAEGYPVELRDGDRDLRAVLIEGVAELKRMTPAQVGHILQKPALTLKKAPYLEKFLQLGLCDVNQLKTLLDARLSRILEDLAGRDYLFFEFLDGQGENLAGDNVNSLKRFRPELPSFLKAALSENGHILRQLEHFCVKAPQGFRFLPAGQFPLKDAEAGRQFRALLPVLRQKFDVILVNLPPFKGSPLAAEMARVCDGAVLVVKRDAVDRRAFKALLDGMRRDGVKLIGTVLNDVPADAEAVI